LFDHFSDGRRVLGGAPFNVAWHLQAFGERPFFVSRVGDDAEAASIRLSMQDWGMDTTGLQTDVRRPTGRVEVRMDNGEPSYDIVHPAAWDAIEPPAETPAISLLYHGSLALRDPTSQQACDVLRARHPPLVFIDVNLRPPWYHTDRLLNGLAGAHWIKLNRDELDQVLPGRNAVRSRAGDLLRRCSLSGLVLTDGAQGAVLVTATGQWYEARPRRDVVVVDTVGAGDALTAIIILGLLRGWPPQQTLDRAQDFASAIVTRRGAIVRDPAFYQPFKDRFRANV